MATPLRRKRTFFVLMGREWPFLFFILGMYFSHIVWRWGCDFSIFPGDNIDSRYQMACLEYNYIFWKKFPNVSLFNAPYFYPFDSSLLLSDSFLFTSIPYIIFRIMGINMEYSFSFWLILGIFSKYVTAYYVLRKSFMPPWLSGAGAFLFALSLPILGMLDPKTLYLFATPLTLYYFQMFISSMNVKYLRISVMWLGVQGLFFIQGGYMLAFCLMIMFMLYFLLYVRSVSILWKSYIVGIFSLRSIPYLLPLSLYVIIAILHTRYTYNREPISLHVLSYFISAPQSLIYHNIYAYFAHLLGPYAYIRAQMIGLITLFLFLLVALNSSARKNVIWKLFFYSFLAITLLTTSINSKGQSMHDIFLSILLLMIML